MGWREIDLVLELEEGYIVFEIKQSSKVSSSDARHLRGLDEIFDKPVLASILLSEDSDLQVFEENIIAMPTAWFLA